MKLKGQTKWAARFFVIFNFRIQVPIFQNLFNNLFQFVFVFLVGKRDEQKYHAQAD